MAENIRFTADFDDSQLQAAMQQLIRAVETGQVRFDRLGDEGSQAMQQIAQASKNTQKEVLATAAATANFSKTVNASGRQIKLTASEAQNLSFQLQDLIVQIGSGQGIFRPLLQQGPQIVQIFGSVGNTFRFFGQQAARALRAVFSLRGGIVLLGSSVAALVALPIILFLTRSERAANAFGNTFARIGGVLGELTNRFVRFGEVLVDFFSREASFRDVTSAAAESVRGLGASLSEAGDRAVRLRQELKALQGAQAAIAIQNVELERQAAVARAQAENDSQGISTRIKLIQQAGRAEAQARQNAITLAREELRIASEQKKDRATINELTERLNKLVAENSVAQVRAQNEINALIRQQRDSILQLRDEYEQLLSAFDSPAQEVERAYSAAIEKIRELRAESRQLGVDLDFGRLEELTRLQFERAKDAALGEISQLPAGLERQRQQLTDIFGNMTADFVDGPGTDFEAAGREIAGKLAKGAAEGLRQESIAEEIRTSLARAFDLTDAQLDFIASKAGQVIGALTQTIDAATKAQIVQQDRLLQAIETRITETQRLLDQELRQQEQGYANNVDALKARLEQENAEREQAERKRLDLERKAANQRLLINSAEQVSNYILAITKLTAVEAGKGIVGIFTAIAGVALIASIIARARASAEQFRDVPQFRTGTEFVDGPGNKYSDSIPARLSRGERVVPADLNEAIGGRAMSNEEMVRLFQLGRMVEDRLPALRTPAPAAVDVSAILREIQRRQVELATLRQERDDRTMREAYELAADRAAEKMIAYWKTRPTEWIDNDGARVLERHEGGRIERKRIKG